MEKVDVVVSLIPYTFHATVIKSAIRTKTNVVVSNEWADIRKSPIDKIIDHQLRFSRYGGA